MQECFRHAKALGAWGAGIEALEVAGVMPEDTGIVAGDDPAEVFTAVHELLGAHRVWERFDTVLEV